MDTYWINVREKPSRYFFRILRIFVEKPNHNITGYYVLLGWKERLTYKRSYNLISHDKGLATQCTKALGLAMSVVL